MCRRISKQQNIYWFGIVLRVIMSANQFSEKVVDSFYYSDSQEQIADCTVIRAECPERLMEVLWDAIFDISAHPWLRL